MEQILNSNKRKKNLLANKLRKLEDKLSRAQNQIPYLTEKYEYKHQQKLAELSFKQKTKLFPLERNALGKEYFDYELQEKLKQKETELYYALKESEDEYDSKIKEHQKLQSELARSHELKDILNEAKQELRGPLIQNAPATYLVDESELLSFEVDYISKIEKLRNEFTDEMRKTQTALDQLVQEQRDQEVLYHKYEEQLSSYTQGYSVLNHVLEQIGSRNPVEYHEGDSKELTAELKKVDQLFDRLLTKLGEQIGKTTKSLALLTDLKVHEEAYKQKVNQLFDTFESNKKALHVEYSDDKYETWQKAHNTQNINGSISEIVASNKEVYEKAQKEADAKYNALEARLEAKKQAKLDKVKPKVNQKIDKIEQQINEVQRDINTEVEVTINNLRTRYQECDPNSDEGQKLSRALSLVDNPEDETQLLVTNLTMQFGGLKAVNDLSFHVNRNEIYGLIGPNGAGKTTVFNCLTQFYQATNGSMLFKNDEGQLINLTDYKVHEVINHGIVRTFQNIELIWEISILDNMLVGAHTAYRTGFFDHLFHLPTLKAEEYRNRVRALDILEKLGLLEYKDQRPVGLPYGVLKRVELARTMMLNPKIIILDEPAAGLNEAETKELAKLIRDIRETFNVTIFLVEHDMGLVMDICDRITAISFGKHLCTGSPEQIQKDPLVQEAYLGGQDNG